jgi:hypothetical protein
MNRHQNDIRTPIVILLLAAGLPFAGSCARFHDGAKDNTAQHLLPEAGGTVNVRQFGAVGDGKADDTKAIRRAIAALPAKGGVLFFPPGHYMTDTLVIPDHTTFLAHSAWSYGKPGGTILSPLRDDQPCLIDARYKVGTRFVGLTLNGLKKGKAMHGILSGTKGDRDKGAQEQHLVIDDCRFEQFTGSGFSAVLGWVWSVQNSHFYYNGLDGIDVQYSYDGWIHNCEFSANGRHGIYGNSSIAITGNRIEWNEAAGIELNPETDSVQITGNLFCSNKGPAIEILGSHAKSISITGNTMRYSGYGITVPTTRSCHVKFENVRGLAFTGNSLLGNSDCPQFGMVVSNLMDSVIADNALGGAATRELIRDRGGHCNAVITNNPGSLVLPALTPKTP